MSDFYFTSILIRQELGGVGENVEVNIPVYDWND